MTIFGNTDRLARKPIITYTQKSSSEHEDAMEIKKKKRVLLEDEASDWLQIRTAAFLLKKVTKQIKKFFCFLSNWSFFFSFQICHIRFVHP